MSELMEYKCPCCGGDVEFNSNTQQMQCPYCGSEFDVDAMKDASDMPSGNDRALTTDMFQGQDWANGETDGMKVYSCKSCGGEIVADETTGASSCPYCGNPVVMTGSFSGDMRPELVIPFKKDKEAAKQALKNHLKGKKFLPKMFSDQNHIDEIKGVYVPFWLFDAEADADIMYKAKKVRRWDDNKFEYEETSYFTARRKGTISYEYVPVDGSSKMEDDLMESIEPFNFKDAVDFKTAYLSGYLADRYDVTAEDVIKRANERIENSVIDKFQESVRGYDGVETEGKYIDLQNGKAKYVLYPVWILNTTWNGEKFTFAMNGQTGKFVGNLPLDKGAYWRTFGILSVVCTILTYMIMSFFN